MDMANKRPSNALGGKRRGSRLARRENIAGWLFISLNLLGYIAFKLLPILFSLFLSFCNWNLISGLSGITFTGIENYKALFSDNLFFVSLRNTVIFAFISVPVEIILALILAVILNDKIFAKSVVRLSFFIPYVSSMTAVSLIWNILYMKSFGPINMFLKSMGVANPPGWLTSSHWALASIIIMSVWQVFGYNSIILLAGLQGVDRTLYEAADMDGAGAFVKFRKITIPMLSSSLFFVAVTSIIGSFQVFTQVQIMTQGGPGSATTVLVYYIYQTAFWYNKIGYANALGWALFVIVFIFTAIQWKFSGKSD